MLVYFVNHSTAPINLGGAERSMIALVEQWYANDPEFEAVFITKAPRGKFIDAIEERGWKYRAFRYRGWTIPRADAPKSEKMYFANDDYRSTLQIIRMMEERRPDLVVTNTLVAPWGAFAAAVVGVPHAWFVREYGDLDHGLAFQIGRASTLEDIARLSNAVFANSLALREHLLQHMPETEISVVYPHVDHRRQDVLANETPVVAPFSGDPGLAVTMVGRLADSKGQWRAIEAIAALKERGVRASLCLVGGQERPDYDLELRRRAERLGVADRLVIAGEQANPFPYIAAADVCVTASDFEAFGRTTLEYMFAGKPVVASDRGGSIELVDVGTTGYLFDPEEPDGLIDALEKYARDPQLRAAHGAAASARALELADHEFSTERAIERLRSLAGESPYRLPNIARYWFELPGIYFSSTSRRGPITAAFLRTRLGGRVKAVLRRPAQLLRQRGLR